MILHEFVWTMLFLTTNYHYFFMRLIKVYYTKNCSCNYQLHESSTTKRVRTAFVSFADNTSCLSVIKQTRELECSCPFVSFVVEKTNLTYEMLFLFLAAGNASWSDRTVFAFLEYVYSLEYGSIVTVEIFDVLVHVEHVINDAAIYCTFKQVL